MLLVALIVAHVVCCIVIINRLHATAIPHWYLKAIDVLWYLIMIAGPVMLGVWSWTRAGNTLPWPWPVEPHVLARLDLVAENYALITSVVGVWGLISWSVGRWRHTGEALVGDEQARHYDLTTTASGRSAISLGTRLLASLPGNQVFDLVVQEKTLVVPNLPSALAGMSIAHLSDLHFTGRTGAGYYQAVVDHANQFDADFVVITGDIIDKRRCFAWLTDLLGQLRSRQGKFFVLGNHDLRVHDEPRVRKTLESAGFQDLGGRTVMQTFRGFPLVWAGNELPWFSPAADLRDLTGAAGSEEAFRIVVAHSPDQIDWARAHGCRLMLAGHTHGGQIRLPIVGPVFSPSRYGVRYAAGTFFVPPTLLHVSRGLSGTQSVRFGCPPELAKLTLRRETPAKVP